jgi:DNA-binding XRE family transcriptional regulator
MLKYLSCEVGILEKTLENDLKQILEKRNINITGLNGLDKKAKVHRNTINKFIIKSTIPRLDIAHKIAKALDLSIYDIWKLK